MVDGIINLNLQFVDAVHKMFIRKREKMAKKTGIQFMSWEEYFIYLNSMIK